MNAFAKSILALALAAMTLASCSGGNTPAGTDAPDGTNSSEPEVTTEAAPSELNIVTDGATDYIILRAENSSSAVTSSAMFLRKYIEKCGVKIRITTDWEGNGKAEHEIVVGDTERTAEDGNTFDAHSVGEEGYYAYAADGRIYLGGGSSAAVQKAVEAFLTEFFGYAGDPETASAVTSVSVPADYNSVTRQTYAIERVEIAGKDLTGYTIIAKDKNTKKIAETVQNAFYQTCGIWLPIAEDGTEGSRILLETGSNFVKEKGNFEATVWQNGDLHLASDVENGILRGFSKFFAASVLGKEGVVSLGTDLSFSDPVGSYVTYSEFGAKGDGKTDDFAAIIKAHEYANKNNMEVRGDAGATYYIGRHEKTAEIQTNVDWTGASFIIDDTLMDTSIRQTHTFHVSRTTESIDLKKLGVKSFKKGAESLGVTLDSDCYVYAVNDNKKMFIREGANQNSGTSQTDCFILRADGTVDPTTPIIWDFDQVTLLRAYPLETETLTIKGGTITTIANQAESKYTYYTTGIEVSRSNVVIDGLTHYVKGELDHGAPYDAIIQVNECANVTVKNCTFTAHLIYSTIGSAGVDVKMGSYDLRARRAINVTYENCVQTTDILDTKYWGLFCSDFCKNLTFDGCTFSRFDAHQGVTNATIRNSTLGHQCLNAIGHGLLTIENSTLYGSNFISLRGDYGSTWNGDVVIKDCTWNPNLGRGVSNQTALIGGSYSGFHNFGYECYMPQNITIDGLHVVDKKRGASFKGINLFANITSAYTSEAYEAKVEKEGYPYHLTKTVTIKGLTYESGKDYGWQISPNKFMFRNVVVTDLDAK